MNTKIMASEKSSGKKVLSTIGNVIIWIFIVFAVIITVLALTAQNSRDGIPGVFGYKFLTVQSSSMEPNEAVNPDALKYEVKGFYAGDLIIGKELTEADKQELAVGDVITYRLTEALDNGLKAGDLNTHRIVEVTREDRGGDGNQLHCVYRVQGDHNAEPDKADVDSSDVYVKYTGTRIPHLGSFVDWLKPKGLTDFTSGFFLLIMVPLIIFFILELVSFIRKFTALKYEGTKNITAADEEEIRQRAVAEYLRQQEEAKAAEVNAQPEGTVAPSETTEPETEAPAEAPAEEAPVEETAEETPAEETAEEAPAEETPAEEAPAEETAEEAPAEETAEEAPAEETPAEETTEEKPE